MILIVVLGFLSLLLIGFPVAWALISISVLYTLWNGIPVADVVITLNEGTGSFTLMAIPFFILAGSLMNSGGVTKRLVEFAEGLVGFLRGGLAYVTILTNMIMAGMSGSGVADAAATGSMLIPAMQRAGYSRGFACAVTAAAGTIGPVIPPSVAFLVYGSLTGVPIGTLFVAGAIPGVVMGILFAVAAYFVAKRDNLPVGKRYTLAEVGRATVKALPALMFPVVIGAGFLFGVFTPTEASVIAVVLAVVIGFAYRELTIERLITSLKESLFISTKVLVVVAAAHLFSMVLTREQAPQKLIEFLLSITEDTYALFALIMFFVVILGCFMDAMPIAVILSPILYKVALSIGLNPVHFGVAFVLALMMGLITPPVGMNLYVVASISDTPMREITKKLIPFVLALAVALALIVAFPQISLFLPGVVGM